MIGLSALAPYKIYAYAALGLALIGGYFYWHHHVYAQGDSAGAQRVQTEFDAYRSNVLQITAQRQAEDAQKDAQAKAINEAVIHDYETKLAAYAADRDSLARRLYALATKAGTCSAAVPTDQDRSPTATASQEPSSEEIIGAVSTYDAACRSDAAQLDALISELKPQL